MIADERSNGKSRAEHLTRRKLMSAAAKGGALGLLGPRLLLAAALVCLLWAAVAVRTAAQTPGEKATPASGPATQPAADRPWIVGVVADNRGGNAAHRSAMQIAKRDKAELILNLGDMVHPAPHCHWNGFVKDMVAVFGKKQAENIIATRYFVTAGGWEEQFINQAQKKKDRAAGKGHLGPGRWPGYEPDNAAGQTFYSRYFKYRDRAGKQGRFIREYTEFGDYYVKYRSLHVISLYLSDEYPVVGKKWHLHDDPAKRKAAIAKQIQWLEDKLKTIRTKAPTSPVIVMAHDGIWWKGSGVLGAIPGLLAKYKVDLAMAGDGHVYYRQNDPWTLKYMLPACMDMKAGGYFRLTIEPKTERLIVQHCKVDGRVLRTRSKKCGRSMAGSPRRPARHGFRHRWRRAGGGLLQQAGPGRAHLHARGNRPAGRRLESQETAHHDRG